MRTRSMGRARGAQPALELSALPDELIARVLACLPSVHDLGRAGCVCRAWRADGSPVEQALRERIKVRDGAVPTALPGAGTMVRRMCWLELLRDARMASDVISLSSVTSAAVDAQGNLSVWGRLNSSSNDNALPIFSYETPTIVQTTRVERISVGICHILALTDEGKVLSFGSGVDGRLGHGDEDDQFEPEVIEALRGVRVVVIAAGGSHSMVLTDMGEVLSFGRGALGPLGHGDDEEDQHEPKVIEALRGTRVVAIASGDMHSMVLTDDGTVLSFGDGDGGQLGHGDEETQRAPKVIEALRGRRVVAIAAGLYQSMVLTDNGEVLSFGDTNRGSDADGPAIMSELQLTPKPIPGLRLTTPNNNALHM